jgi:hypothetical protein
MLLIPFREPAVAIGVAARKERSRLLTYSFLADGNISVPCGQTTRPQVWTGELPWVRRNPAASAEHGPQTMKRTISAHTTRIGRRRTPTNSRTDRFGHWSSSSLSNHTSSRPAARRWTSFLSARSVNQRYAVVGEHPTRSATSVVPDTPPSFRRASRKSSSDHEGVYWPVLSSRSGGTDCVLMPLSYGVYGMILPSSNTTKNFITSVYIVQGTEPRSLGTRWRVRVKAPPGPGFEQVNP